MAVGFIDVENAVVNAGGAQGVSDIVVHMAPSHPFAVTRSKDAPVQASRVSQAKSSVANRLGGQNIKG